MGADAVGLDLNLLISLDALLRERSVTRAAQRLGLTQPTLSAALARLRRHFGDELLVRAGNSYELTPLAERLTESTAQALSWTDRVFRTQPGFDAEHADHEFTLVLTDGHLATFGRVLADLVRAQAPGVRLRFVHSNQEIVQGPVDGLRPVDGILLPQGLLAKVPALDLYEDRWMCVVSAGAGSGALTRDDLATRPWVIPYHYAPLVSGPVHQLRARGIEPRIDISLEGFLPVPYLVAGTDRIGVLPGRAAELIEPGIGAVVVEPPFSLGPLVETLWWHPMHDRDPAHLWLRQIATEAGQVLAQPS
ncbi:LysR family transcriptional regulator [Actinoplanes sp. NPDC023936]|uniref:LysR family transcriptional regulator n=1 Tax=Actinoplanes sp. NPDC023936 TaxID=3154910 RepID=UPI00340A69FE